MARRVDASMDLLTQIIEQPIDPDYARAAAGRPDRRQRSTPGSRAAFGLAVLVITAMVAIAAAQTTRARPAIEHERDQLVARIQSAQTERDRLRDRVNALAAENARLRTEGLAGQPDRELRERLSELELTTGATAAAGPGLRITVDDSSAGAGSDRVLDIDLQILVNGLWAAGAEAIQINGQRVTSLTAIREAGQAITVNYRSLSGPYEIEAIGDPRTLHARFLETSAGAWWNALKQNQGMRYEVAGAEKLELAGVPGLAIRTGRTR